MRAAAAPARSARSWAVREQVDAGRELVGQDRPVHPMASGIEDAGEEARADEFATIDDLAVLLDLDIEPFHGVARVDLGGHSVHIEPLGADHLCQPLLPARRLQSAALDQALKLVETLQ